MMTDLRKLTRRVFGREVIVDLVAQRIGYRAAFLSPTGKRDLLPDLIDYTGVLKPAPLHGDLYAQGRVQGRRDVGLHILENLSLEPVELYAIMKREPNIKPEDFLHG